MSKQAAAARSGSSFKETYGASSEFKGGHVAPESLIIVGVDIPVEDWCEDIHDEARLVMTQAFILGGSASAEAGIEAVIRFGVTDQIIVTRRRGMTLVVDGRSKILAAREANKRLAARKLPARIEVPIVVDKTDDQGVTMRMSNAFRRDDPPWIQADQAAQMKRWGKSDADIKILSGGIDDATLNNWRHYGNVIPEIKRLVEYPEPGIARLPFSVAFEIGRIGKGETARQTLALTVLRNTGAQLTGEAGRSNAKAVAKAILDGQITEAPPPVQGAAPPSPEPASAQEPVPPSGPQVKVPPSTSGPSTSVPTGSRGPNMVVQIGKMPTGQIRQVFKALEGLTDKNLEEKLAFAIFAVLNGMDPQASFLEGHPRIQALFRQAMGIKTGAEPKAPKTPPKAPEPKPASYNVQTDATRSLACPNRTCDKGVDKGKGKARTCETCEGYGKISPIRAAKLAEKGKGK